jgi:hypothetical protein
MQSVRNNHSHAERGNEKEGVAMKKLILVLFAVALVVGLGSSAMAYYDVTWLTVNSTSALGLWPNGLGSPNISEANIGLLGRIVPSAVAKTENLECTGPFTPEACCTGPGTGNCTPNDECTGFQTPDVCCTGPGMGNCPWEWTLDVPNACMLPPSFPCAAGSPPTFLLPTGAAEGPKGAGGGDQCNVVVTGMGLTGVGNAPPNNGPLYLGEDTTRGTYSYYVIHEVGGTNNAIGFFSGAIMNRLDPDNTTPGVANYRCNDCPVGGMGKDLDTQYVNGTSLNAAIRALDRTGAGMPMITVSVNLWATQTVRPFGHEQVRLGATGPGKASICGNSIAFANLVHDFEVDGMSPPGNYYIPNQKTVNYVYSTNLSHHTTGAIADMGKCNAPDCYIEKVIIPAALAQNPAAKNVMMQVTASVLPAGAPGTIANATVDNLLFFYTTDPLDVDVDGEPDNIDPCPNDPTDTCVFDLINNVQCPAGEAFCADDNGYFGCLPPYQCNSRGDVNQDCSVDTADQELVASLDIGGAPLPLAGGDPWMIPAFNTGVPVGPFEP